METVKLKKYAELLVRAGGNVQKGQLVVIQCAVDHAPFARLAQTCAYDAGASEVVIDWIDDFSTREKYFRAADGVFDVFPSWIVARLKEHDDRGAVYLAIPSSDPDLLNGADAGRIRRATVARQTATKTHSELTMTHARRWSVAAVPSVPWARKVFPRLPEEEAVESLWAHILKSARADGDDPIKDWETHGNNFKKRVAYLNQQAFKALRFTNALGTNLTVGLVKGHIWTGGRIKAQDGIDFFPNLPTEEIFTMPDRTGTEGRVVASMPLSYQGNLIEGFEMTFKEGRAVSWRADQNQAALDDIIQMDEGSHYLGEVALVAHSSPIAQMNTLFYKTLFDENASCHLALGKAYPTCLEGGVKMTEAERDAAGVNDSLLHVDFMFGTSDTRVAGIGGDGGETVFFDGGEFVV